MIHPYRTGYMTLDSSDVAGKLASLSAKNAKTEFAIAAAQHIIKDILLPLAGRVSTGSSEVLTPAVHPVVESNEDGTRLNISFEIKHPGFSGGGRYQAPYISRDGTNNARRNLLFAADIVFSMLIDGSVDGVERDGGGRIKTVVNQNTGIIHVPVDALLKAYESLGTEESKAKFERLEKETRIPTVSSVVR